MTVLKYIIVTIMCLFTILDLQAQGISVASFKMLPNDLTANTNGTEVLDQNGDKAALIKVVTTQTGFTFEGGALGICSTKQKNGEIWVYIPQKSKKITLLHQSLGVLRDYYFPCAIESARTYEMQLTSGSVQTVIKKDIGGNFFALKVLPENASVYIDGVLQINDVKGEYSIFLDYGEHQYRVEAGSYSTQSGIVNISDKASELNIKLESVLASLSIICPTQDAEIYLNKNKKGIDKWEGNVLAGKYLIEAKKEGYRSYIENIEVHEKENKTITLPSLEPIYGMLKVNVKPIGSIVEIDGNVVGKTPTILDNVIVGAHSIKVSTAGGGILKKEFILRENEVYSLDEIINDISPEEYVKMAKESFDMCDYEKDFECSVLAANLGNADGIYSLANCYAIASGSTDEDFDKVTAYAKIAKEKYGITNCKDKANELYKTAVSLFQRNINSEALVNLGNCYLLGLGVQIDNNKAFYYYLESTKFNNSDGFYGVGMCYYSGCGVPQNYEKASNYFLKAAELGNVWGLLNIANCYYYGKGQNVNYPKAIEYYKKAADKNNRNALCMLGDCYFSGKGLPKNEARAFNCYKRSAELGFSLAQYNLANCYYHGIGVSVDKQKSKEWYQKAARNGNEEAKKILLQLF